MLSAREVLRAERVIPGVGIEQLLDVDRYRLPASVSLAGWQFARLPLGYRVSGILKIDPAERSLRALALQSCKQGAQHPVFP